MSEAQKLLGRVRANLYAARDSGSLVKLAFVARWLGTCHPSTNTFTAYLEADGIGVNVTVYAYGLAGEGLYVQARCVPTGAPFTTVVDTRRSTSTRFFIFGKWFKVVEGAIPRAREAHEVAQATAGRINLTELRAMLELPEGL